MFDVKSIRAHLIRFRDGTDGVVSIEAILILPILFWAYIGTFVIFDAFKNMNTNQKAAYTISDMFSRETQEIDSSYIDSAQDILAYLTRETDTTAKLRVTMVRWHQRRGRYEVDWSEKRGAGLSTLTTEALYSYNDKLPVMPHGETVILLETFVDFDPPFNIGLDALTFKNLVVTRPRFAPQLVWSGSQG